MNLTLPTFHLRAKKITYFPVVGAEADANYNSYIIFYGNVFFFFFFLPSLISLCSRGQPDHSLGLDLSLESEKREAKWKEI